MSGECLSLYIFLYVLEVQSFVRHYILYKLNTGSTLFVIIFIKRFPFWENVTINIIVSDSNLIQIVSFNKKIKNEHFPFQPDF